MAPRINRRILDARWSCNRHPLRCLRSHRDGGPPCSQHPLLCRWWARGVRPELQRWLRRWTVALRALPRPVAGRALRGQACLALMADAGRPYRIDTRKHSVGRDCTERVYCLRGQPPPPGGVVVAPAAAGAAAPPRGGLFSPALLARVRFWTSAWERVYRWMDGLGLRRTVEFTVQHLRSLVDRLDAEFWDGTIARTMARRGFTPRMIVDTNAHRGLALPRSVWPVCQAVIHRTKLYCGLELNMHPSFHPRYPFLCDGVLVEHWTRYIPHVVAHELVHVVRAILNEPRDIMYDVVWDAMNRWVYGHTAHDDDDVTTGVSYETVH